MVHCGRVTPGPPRPPGSALLHRAELGERLRDWPAGAADPDPLPLVSEHCMCSVAEDLSVVRHGAKEEKVQA